MMDSLFWNTSKGAEERREGGREGGRVRFSIQSHHVICPLLETGFLKRLPVQVGGRHGGEEGGGGEFNPLCYYVIWCGASSISMRKVSMGVSPMSLKKNKCSRHLRPMERSAGNRSNSLANLSHNTGRKWRRETKTALFIWQQEGGMGGGTNCTDTTRIGPHATRMNKCNPKRQVTRV